MGDKDGKTYRSKLLDPCDFCRANGKTNCENPHCYTNIKHLEEKELDEQGCESQNIEWYYSIW